MCLSYSVGDSRFCSLSPYVFSPNDWDPHSTSARVYIHLKVNEYTRTYTRTHMCQCTYAHSHLCMWLPTCIHAHGHPCTRMLLHIWGKRLPFRLASTRYSSCSPMGFQITIHQHPELSLILLVNICSRHGWEGERGEWEGAHEHILCTSAHRFMISRIKAHLILHPQRNENALPGLGALSYPRNYVFLAK